MPKQPARITDENDMVGFRLEKEYRVLLEQQAKREGHKSPTIFARTLVQRALTDTSHAELRRELEAVRKDLRALREDMATLALLLLVKAGNEDPKKAEAWVRQHFAP